MILGWSDHAGPGTLAQPFPLRLLSHGVMDSVRKLSLPSTYHKSRKDSLIRGLSGWDYLQVTVEIEIARRLLPELWVLLLVCVQLTSQTGHSIRALMLMVCLQ